MRDCYSTTLDSMDPLEFSLIPCCSFNIFKNESSLGRKTVSGKVLTEKKCPKFPQNQGDKDLQLDQDLKLKTKN